MADSGGRLHELPKTFPKITFLRRNAEDMNGVNKHRPRNTDISNTEYCQKLQEWMWQYYCSYVNWQSWISPVPYFPTPGTDASPGVPTWGADLANADLRNWANHSWGFSHSSIPPPSTDSAGNGPEVNDTGSRVPDNPPAQLTQHQNGNAQHPGREYSIPSPFQRFLAEMVDFFILFFIKAAVVLSIMYMSGITDISTFALHFIVEEIDEDTSMEELQRMLLVALMYRVLVCVYEIICVWGAGGATPGKLLLGLRVITCDTSVLLQPNRVRVVPATDVSLSASTVRALNKNFSIAFFFPAFITLLFFQHNRTVYDIVAGTIVVKRD
ncbi:protein FAM8A1 [Brachyhypopomus gauderio]|uniref:protein FAM8A1 n=1 Tax=Brachyhypopomus gauderio TaxID=698409 RepID=UPI004042C117